MARKLSAFDELTTADNLDLIVGHSPSAGKNIVIKKENLLKELNTVINAGAIGYATKADMDADTAQDGGTIGIVTNDTAANNGYYRWDDAGASWVARDEFYATTLDPVDESEAVTGKAVDTYIFQSRLAENLPIHERYTSGALTDDINQGGISFSQFYEAIKSIEMVGADLSFDYKVEFIARNHSTSNYRVIIMFLDGGSWQTWIDTGNSFTVTEDTPKLTTVTVQSGNKKATLKIDYSLLPDGGAYRQTSGLTGDPLFIVKPEFLSPDYVSVLKENLPFIRYKAGDLASNINSGDISFFRFYNAVKSVRLYNASADTKYKIEFIGRNDTGFSNYRIIIYELSGSGWVSFIDTGNSFTVTENTGGVTEVIAKDTVNESNRAVLQIDYSLLPDGDFYRQTSGLTGDPLFIIKPEFVSVPDIGELPFKRYKEGELSSEIDHGNISFFRFYSAVKSVILPNGFFDTKYKVEFIARNDTTYSYRIIIHMLSAGEWVEFIDTGSSFAVTENTDGVTTVTAIDSNNPDQYAILEIDYNELPDGDHYRQTSGLTGDPLFTIEPKEETVKVYRAIGGTEQNGLNHEETFVAAAVENDKPHRVEAEVNIGSKESGAQSKNRKYLACHWADGRDTDSNAIAPLLLKYGFTSTFNAINHGINHNSNRSQPMTVKKLIASGMDIGEHGIFHSPFYYNSPNWNGQTEGSEDGTQSAYPSNSDLRADRGDGNNVFGKDITSLIGDAFFELADNEDYSNIAWQDLTNAQCQVIRKSYSAFSRPTFIERLDDLSNRYCGTSGSSVWDGGSSEYSGGIFQGCKTSQNHEIWERLWKIQSGYFAEFFGYTLPLIYWTYQGGANASIYIEDNGTLYHDKSKTKLANYWAEFNSVRISDSRSWVDVIQSFGVTMAKGSSLLAETDTGGLRTGGLNLSLGPTIPELLYQNKEDIRFWEWNTDLYSSNSEPLASSDNWLKTIYEDYNKFSDPLNDMMGQIGNGRIPIMSDDSFDNFDYLLWWELLLMFCKKAGIEVISLREAKNIVNRPYEGNLFPNPTFDTTINDIIKPTTPELTPDGWSQGQIVTDVVDGLSTRVIEIASSAELKIYSVDYGTLEFSFYTNGTGTVEIYLIRAKHRLNNTSDYELYDTISVDSSAYSSSLSSIKIPHPVKDEDWHDHLLDAGSSKTYSQCMGYDEAIVGLMVKVSGTNIRFALPKLTK